VTLVWLALLAPVSAQTVSDAIEKGRTVFFSRGCSGRHRVGAAGTPIAHDLSHVGSKFTEGDLASLVARSDKPEAHGAYAAPGAVLRPGQVAPDASRNPLTGVLSCIWGSEGVNAGACSQRLGVSGDSREWPFLLAVRADACR
jgi:hypothetical protein